MLAQIDCLVTGLRDSDNTPLNGGKIYSYAEGTSTAKDLYLDPVGTQVAPNPLTLDARGCAEVWGDGRYKFVIKNAALTTIATYDYLTYDNGFRRSHWVPSFGASGSMVVSFVDIIRADYWKHHAMCWIALTARVLLGGTASTGIYFTLPLTAYNALWAYMAVGPANLYNLYNKMGLCTINSDQSLATVSVYSGANYSLVPTTINLMMGYWIA